MIDRPLRVAIRENIEAQIDYAILHGSDRELAALLARHRSTVLTIAVTEAESAVLRQLLAHEPDQHEDAEPVRVNGHKHNGRHARH